MAAHERGLRVLLDIVPCHTSIEHPWFTEHPERYVWSDRDGPQNNWLASFGGRSWSRDERSGGWYLHSFYPEQPDLNWRCDDVRMAMADVLRFWIARGVDGFRLDAIDRLMKDPELRDDPPASGPSALPEHGECATLDMRHSRNAPDIGDALAVLREGAGANALLVGEVYLPAAELRPYLEHVDIAFAFEPLHAPWEASAVRAAVQAGLQAGRVAWVLSNHDFPRLPDRVGAQNVRAAALLALTLPGPVFVYQGDELGMADGPGREPPDDRAGRDRHRHPMRWDDDAPHGGFSDGEPWLPAIEVTGGGASKQERDPDSVLALYRDLIALRRDLEPGLEFLDAGPRRGRPRLPPRDRPRHRDQPRRRARRRPAGGRDPSRDARRKAPRRVRRAAPARARGRVPGASVLERSSDIATVRFDTSGRGYRRFPCGGGSSSRWVL